MSPPVHTAAPVLPCGAANPVKQALTALADALSSARRRKSYSTGFALAGWW
jgi:hypothetical protein